MHVWLLGIYTGSGLTQRHTPAHYQYNGHLMPREFRRRRVVINETALLSFGMEIDETIFTF